MLFSFPPELTLRVISFLPNASLTALIQTQKGVARLVTPYLYKQVLHEPIPLEKDEDNDSDDDDFDSVYSENSEEEVPPLPWTDCVGRWHSDVILNYFQSLSAEVLSNCGKPRESLLHLAARTGNIPLMELLLSKGLDINNCHDGYSPVARAVIHRQDEMVLWLMEKNAPVTGGINGGRLTVLTMAAGFCSGKVVQRIVEIIRAEVGERGNVFAPSDSIDALHRAIRKDDPLSVHILLENGADASGWDTHGLSGLTLAASKGNDEIVTMLLDRNANPLPHDAVGQSALGCAGCSQKLSWEIMERIFHAFREAGGDINATEVTIPEFVGGRPRALESLPLHYFACAGSIKGVELLLRHGADVTIKPRNGMTPLHAVLFRYKHTRDPFPEATQICQILIEAAVRSNKHLNDQMTPYAPFTPMNGGTALTMAVICGLEDVVRLLVENGADVQVVDAEGKTALDYARSSSNQTMIDLLTGRVN
ncbi:hypothetical protein ASPWEDRAFT_170515 [Aspergillus wentii DTO 134E9]|uniref:Uncharacterized protein n=1 Tax=Aspergillus wentii DTO 134E9 TaxID=1073089 RepID=A0A1L9RQC3_ASPWE|nr:uncharacterized protein ASPWEDRAFT_170515 [Aspergillus wentii DTO 134E9]OJJ37018.1 hypothetical protein ASPWEDRAFT_170515 [Aspergillus wentii DTO 134E9]